MTALAGPPTRHTQSPPIQRSVVRVLSVPADHVYVRHIAPLPGEAPTGSAISRLRDPQDPWWPPPALEPAWLAQRTGEFDLLHLHFGFDARCVEDLRAVVDVLAAAGRPLVQTVHDLRNPHHLDPETHDAHLDVLIPSADAVITLTQGAADEIRDRWGRTAVVLPHPHVVDLVDLGSRQVRRPRRREGRFVVGLHLKSMRPCMSGRPVVEALARAVHEIGDAVLRIDVHRDVAEVGGERYDQDLVAALEAAAEGGAEVAVHDFFDDDALWDYLQAIDVSVLPYRYGTHSGWLEACRDLGTAVAAPDCGYYAQQGWVYPFHLDEDGLDECSLLRAVRDARDAGPATPVAVPVRAAQRRRLAEAHRDIYLDVLQ